MKMQYAAIGFALFVVFAVSSVIGKDTPLTNEDIVRLTQAGLGAEVIITKIRASVAAFDTSVEQLLALKKAGVEDSVITVMVDKGAAAPAVDTASQTAPTTTPASSPALPAVGSSFRDTLRSGGQGPEMVVIPAGRFHMGCVSGRDCKDIEKPVHEVMIGRPFAMSKYEVTFKDYDKFTAQDKVDDEGWGRGPQPIINISWDDAAEYAEWLSAQTGKRYRLPTEAEWEYAARAGTTTEYFWGNDIGENRANCDDDSCGDWWGNTAPVGSFQANAWGLHDMHGNVWEWVQDCWNDSYTDAPTDGSAWMSGDCGQRAGRGGACVNWSSMLRSSNRAGFRRTTRIYSVGFRLVQDL